MTKSGVILWDRPFKIFTISFGGQVMVGPGDQVAAGDPLVVMIAMKMEYVIKVPVSRTWSIVCKCDRKIVEYQSTNRGNLGTVLRKSYGPRWKHYFNNLIGKILIFRHTLLVKDMILINKAFNKKKSLKIAFFPRKYRTSLKDEVKKRCVKNMRQYKLLLHLKYIRQKIYLVHCFLV